MFCGNNSNLVRITKFLLTQSKVGWDNKSFVKIPEFSWGKTIFVDWKNTGDITNLLIML